MSRAFDRRRPPEQDHIDACVHCGFCLPACPTYLLWGQEMDSPRGRIVLMAEGLREGSSMSPGLVGHLDRCLGCMACVTACPSGVRYDRLIERARPQVERRAGRPVGERVLRRLLLEVFTHPGRLRALMPVAAAARGMGLDRLVARSPALDARFPRTAALARLAASAPRAASGARRTSRATPNGGTRSTLARVTRAEGRRRGRVGLLQGCVQRVLFSGVNQATADVLSAEGFEVVAPRSPVAAER